VAVSAIAARTTSGSTPTVLADAEKLTCPILLQHGMKDPVVPYEDSVLLDKTLKSLRRNVKLLSYPDAGHNDLPWEKVYGEVLSFFQTHLHGRAPR
jgi:dipeptidyl aminopeptidase/acylaminoacyl peptidase